MEKKFIFKDGSNEGLNWNKDLACLEEVQRLERISNDSCLIGDSITRYNALVCISSVIKPLCSPSEINTLNKLAVRCIIKGGRGNNKINVNGLDPFNDELHRLMVVKNIHLNSKVDSSEAVNL